MNDPNLDLEQFENQLRRLTPARPPEALLGRLQEAPNLAPTKPEAATKRHAPTLSLAWWHRLGWLIPTAAGATAVLMLAVGITIGRRVADSRSTAAAGHTSGSKAVAAAENIEFDQHVVASFDAVAQLPDGQPVRFRCREWSDGVVLTDPKSGLVIERKTPRLEIVPVSFDTY
jgi:hypothetical protein